MPAYLRLDHAELRRRAEAALELLRACEVCPRNCHVDRLADHWSFCKIGRYAVVSSAFPHFGEEDCLRGWNGSGTIFFSMCNLRCVFCQNFDISQQKVGREVSARELAQIMIALQERGCHNINFVTPEHVVPQILEALPHAVEMGLRLPLVYNTSSYDSMHSLRLLDGIVDIYMPDFKYWDPESARLYLKAPDYPEVARRTIAEMHRQVGPLVIDRSGLARRGVLLRHLVMPGALEETRQIMRWIAETLGRNTYVNVMAQYHPAGQVGRNPRYAAINRRLFPEEYAAAVRAALDVGLTRLDHRLAGAVFP
ncbi:MAG: radical SAM protein [Armatimonadota bacterium]|nr:radical SAM protein [Armatimonadota bacterium]MDR7450831.1 radical SAM protein [Armatimonadota bacterium]MDR7465752.1 radical SAM protein [Armatimonadota bacterium]MDR7499091.1 radical SAM protein [Armatimonadota bacterium]MDR7546515.1 radical SAM protein [Armatimonadota bacterium]